MASSSVNDCVNFHEYVALDDDFEYILEVLEDDESLEEEINDVCANVSYFFVFTSKLYM